MRGQRHFEVIGDGFPYGYGGPMMNGAAVMGAPFYGGVGAAPSPMAHLAADQMAAAAHSAHPTAQMYAQAAALAQAQQQALAQQFVNAHPAVLQQAWAAAAGLTPQVTPTPGGGLVAVTEPAWRQRQLAPGVQAPDEDMLPLPLSPIGGSGTFTSVTTSITFQGQIQKPFRGERLLVDKVATGTSAVGKLQGQLFVGTNLQQLDIFPFSLEQVGQVQGFGVRLSMMPAQPGVFIRIVTTLTQALTGTDKIFADMTILGRLVQ